ncbi:protein SirB1 [Klebsiella aerogenes]|nr:protein SirB1 [Klebsiella aerogenes]
MAELFNEDLDEADNAEVIRKLLDTLKSALMEERQMDWLCAPAKRCCSLTRKIRMRSATRAVYAQLDCDHVALLDLSYFVEQCPRIRSVR